MYRGKSFLAIIPARGGSKRLPKKNILPLCGKPLVVWSIEAGIRSKYVDKVIVSSDCDAILETAHEYGVDIVKRPEELASDTSTTFEAVKHTIERYKEHDYIVLLQPTSPLRNEYHIDDAIEYLDNKNADAIISVCETDHSPLWCNTLPINNSLKTFRNEKAKGLRSQDLERYYRVNGALYICKKEKLLNEKSFFISDNIYAYKMKKEESIDIDEKLDFKFAELLLQENQ